MKKCIFTLASIVTSLTVSATEQPFKLNDSIFVGMKGGYNLANDTNYNHSSPDSWVLGVYGGVQFSPFWSWELGYQKPSPLKASATQVEVETWLIESALRYDKPLNTDFSAYGRFGAAYWQMDKQQITPLTSEKATGFSPLAELGLAYHINQNTRLSVGYQYIDAIGNKETTGQYDSHSLFLSFDYAFKNKAADKKVGLSGQAQ